MDYTPTQWERHLRELANPPHTRQAGTVRTIWEVWTYDVWGNERYGYEVNDRCCTERRLVLHVPATIYNVGTEGEFQGAYPSDRQIREAFGVSCTIETDGDDTTVYVNRERDGYPIGELHCTSHDSLSPVRSVLHKVGG